MSFHVNHVTLIGKTLKTWTYGNDRVVRLQILRPGFYPPRAGGSHDLVTVVLPEAKSRGMVVEEGDDLHIEGFIRNDDREISLHSLAKINTPELKEMKVRQIVTEVVAKDWRILQNR